MFAYISYSRQFLNPVFSQFGLSNEINEVGKPEIFCFWHRILASVCVSGKSVPFWWERHNIEGKQNE